MSSLPLGLGESKVSTCPAFAILVEPSWYLVMVKGKQDAKFRLVDMTDRKMRFVLVRSIAEAFPDLGSGDGLLSLLRAVRELAAGQACAGSTVDESRAVVKSIADSTLSPTVVIAERATLAGSESPPTPKRRNKAAEIRKMNLELAGVAL